MTTKPEGPAQEPRCLCGHNEATHAVQVSTSGSRLHGCYVCSDCDHFVPATPAPSQPAGKFIGYVAFGCGKHPSNANGAHGYKLDCLDCQRQPVLAWFEGEPPIQPPTPSQPCGKWNKLHVMTLLTDVAQLLDGWHQDGTAWSEWDEEVRQGVSSYLRQVHTTPSEQFDTSVTALRQENARLKKSLAAADAEREHDSLREFLESEIHNDKCDCLKCIRIRKALKAGQEPKL